MTVETETHRQLSDYSLVGEEAALAVQRGLADAKWYASPIPSSLSESLRLRARFVVDWVPTGITAHPLTARDTRHGAHVHHG